MKILKIIQKKIKKKNDILDFDFFYYITRTVLNLSEDDFWSSTPKKIQTLFDIHCNFNGIEIKEEIKNKKQKNVKFISEVPWLQLINCIKKCNNYSNKGVLL